MLDHTVLSQKPSPNALQPIPKGKNLRVYPRHRRRRPTSSLSSPSLLTLELMQPKLSSPLHPISHLAISPSYVATASSTLLTVWHLNPSFPSSPTPSNKLPPSCHLQSQWLSPTDFHISSLALSPDDSALVISLQDQHPSHPNKNITIALLHPYTCTLLLRIALPHSLAFVPSSSPTPTLHKPLCFVSCAPPPDPLTPLVSTSHSADLPSHLQVIFEQNSGTAPLPSNIKRASHLSTLLAPFALAVSGSNGLTIIYRFISSYRSLFDCTRIHSSQFFHSPAHWQVHPVIQLHPSHAHTDSQGLEDRIENIDHDFLSTLLGFCTTDGAVLIRDSMPFLQIPASSFRPVAVCAAHIDSNGVSHVVLLAVGNPNLQLASKRPSLDKPPVQKKQRQVGRERLCWVVWNSKEEFQISSIDDFEENDVMTVAVLKESWTALSVLIMCITGKILRFRIVFETDHSFHVSKIQTSDELEHMLADGQSDMNQVLTLRGGKVISVRAAGKSVFVRAIAARPQSEGGFS